MELEGFRVEGTRVGTEVVDAVGEFVRL